MDAFAHFEEQERSWAKLKELEGHLARDASEILAAHPEATLAGLILEAGAPEFSVFRTAIEQATGQELNPAGLAGIVPLEIAVQAARRSGGEAAVRWLAANTGTKLPIVSCTKNGMRMGAVEIVRPDLDVR